MNSTIALAVLACLITLAVTPLVRSGARALGIVDRPDGHRKLHRCATPLGGGVAVLVGLALAIGMALAGQGLGRDILLQEPVLLSGLAVASIVICAVGLVDDRIGLRGRHKLVGQIAAAGILIYAGFRVEQIRFLDWQVDLGLLAVPATLLWLLATINALNLIDGMDGLASGVGIVMSGAVAFAAGLQGQAFECCLALMMAGSLLGFFYYNFHPARMFLGDAGSMLIGLVLGTLTLRCSFREPGSSVLAIPVAMWAIPFFDVGMAILRRKLTGRSIFTTDRGHLHHCLLQRKYGCRTALLSIISLCLCVAVGSVAAVYYQNDVWAVGAVLAVTGTMVVTGYFGQAECTLLCRRLTSFARSLVLLNRDADGRSRQFSTHLQGRQRWDELWQALIVYAERFDLTGIQLNVNVPSIHEEYHASWNRKISRDHTQLCDTEIPLIARECTVGRIKITIDPVQRDSMCGWMSELMDGLKPFESHLLCLLEPPEPDPLLAPGAAALGSRPVEQRMPRAVEAFPASALAIAAIKVAQH